MAQKTRPGLQTTIDSNLPDNTTDFITPLLHREVEEDLKDSNFNILDDTAFNVNYTPTTPLDWDTTVPTETGGALDILIKKSLVNPSDNIAYVSTTGSNTVGEFEIGNPLKPFLSPNAAAAAVGAGGIVKFLGGVYSSLIFMNVANVTLDISGCTIQDRIILDADNITVIAYGAKVSASTSFAIGTSAPKTGIKIFGGTYTGTGVVGIDAESSSFGGWKIYDCVFNSNSSIGNQLKNVISENCDFNNTGTGIGLIVDVKVSLSGGIVNGASFGIQVRDAELILKNKVEIIGENGINGITTPNYICNIVAETGAKITGTLGYGVRLVNKADVVKFDSCTINGATDTIVYDGDGGLGVYRTVGTNNIFKNNTLYAGSGQIINGTYLGSDAGVANMNGNLSNKTIVFGAKVIDNSFNSVVTGLQEI